MLVRPFRFEYHTFLHHSQTSAAKRRKMRRLSTIHFYIILKLWTCRQANRVSLSTIHFYIILKLVVVRVVHVICLSTIHFYIILKPQI